MAKKTVFSQMQSPTRAQQAMIAQIWRARLTQDWAFRHNTRVLRWAWVALVTAALVLLLWERGF